MAGWFKNAIKVICSVLVCAAGVEMVLLSGYGLDPLTGFEFALSVRLGISLGKAALLFEGLTFFLFWFIQRGLLGFGSFAFCFGIGPAIDLWSRLLSRFYPPVSPVVCLFWLLAGSVCITLSIAYYVPLNFGLQSLDMYSTMAASLLKKQYGTGLTAVYVILIILGAAMGKKPGPATVCAVFLYGKIIDWFRMKLYPD